MVGEFINAYVEFARMVRVDAFCLHDEMHFYKINQFSQWIREIWWVPYVHPRPTSHEARYEGVIVCLVQ